MQHILLFHCNNGCINAPPCYFTLRPTLFVLFVNISSSWHVILRMYLTLEKLVIKLFLCGTTYTCVHLSHGLFAPFVDLCNILWGHVLLTMNMKNHFSGRNILNQKRKRETKVCEQLACFVSSNNEKLSNKMSLTKRVALSRPEFFVLAFCPFPSLPTIISLLGSRQNIFPETIFSVLCEL